MSPEHISRQALLSRLRRRHHTVACVQRALRRGDESALAWCQLNGCSAEQPTAPTALAWIAGLEAGLRCAVRFTERSRAKKEGDR